MIERIYKCDFCGTVMNPNDSYNLEIKLSPHRAHQLSAVWNPSAQLCSDCANKFWNNVFKLKDGGDRHVSNNNFDTIEDYD